MAARKKNVITLSNYVKTRDSTIRRIVLSHESGIPSPVWRVVREGKFKNSYQIIKSGDFVLSKISKANGPDHFYRDVTIARIDENGSVKLLPITRESLWRTLSKTAMAWLDNGPGPLLPTNVGWDGRESELEKLKRVRLTRFFSGLPGVFIDTLIEKAKYTSSKQLPTYWFDESVDGMPTSVPVENNHLRNITVVAWDKTNQPYVFEVKEGCEMCYYPDNDIVKLVVIVEKTEYPTEPDGHPRTELSWSLYANKRLLGLHRRKERKPVNKAA